MGKLNGQQRCPKCGGNMFLYNDQYGWYEQCLQCAHTLSLNLVYKGGTKAASRKRAVRQQGIAG